MKTEVVPTNTRDTKAWASLKSPPNKKIVESKFFEVLYDFLLFAAIPIAFEMSYIKIAKISLHAYSGNDLPAIGRLMIYLAIQWLLGVLVRNKYATITLKRITLVLMIMIQLKEAFIEEVLVDMMISMILESSLAILLFFKFTQLMVILKFMGLFLFISGIVLFISKHPYLLVSDILGAVKSLSSIINKMIRTYYCRYSHLWHTHFYCRPHMHYTAMPGWPNKAYNRLLIP